ncbi:hypothetical protein ACP70R_046943 [Stipagrostis hirtigluma subsp. patula]
MGRRRIAVARWLVRDSADRAARRVTARPGDAVRPHRGGRERPGPAVRAPGPALPPLRQLVPAQADHTAILAAPETRVTTLPSGLRVAMESSLAARTATVSAAAVSTVSTSGHHQAAGSSTLLVQVCRPWWRRRAPARRQHGGGR